jgi:uncharacterized membrane protein YgcG
MDESDAQTDHLTLLAVIMVLLEKVGGSKTIELDEANAVFERWKLGVHRTDDRLSLALVSPERARAMHESGADIHFFE